MGWKSLVDKIVNIIASIVAGIVYFIKTLSAEIKRRHGENTTAIYSRVQNAQPHNSPITKRYTSNYYRHRRLPICHTGNCINHSPVIDESNKSIRSPSFFGGGNGDDMESKLKRIRWI